MPRNVAPASGLASQAPFVRPAKSAAELYAPARKSAREVAVMTFVVSFAGLLFITFCVAIFGGAEKHITTSSVLTAAALAVLVSALISWWAFGQITNHNWATLSKKCIEGAQAVLRASLHSVEQSKRCRAGLAALLNECDAVVDDAQTEFKARRFAVFWDRIEQAAAKLAELQKRIDELRSLQQFYVARLQGYEHNFSAFLPGCRAIPANVPTIERYYDLVRKAQADIDFALIWEHRQTRAVMIAGFTTLGDMVQNVGSSLQQSLQQLIAVECAPRYSIGFIR
jgi:hypothetical protein